MTKFLIGMATAALWFMLSHAANADLTCRQEAAAKFPITTAACGAAFPGPVHG
jgi:hypothetical protein